MRVEGDRVLRDRVVRGRVVRGWVGGGGLGPREAAAAAVVREQVLLGTPAVSVPRVVTLTG